MDYYLISEIANRVEGTCFDESLIERVLEMLESLSYKPQSADVLVIVLSMVRVDNDIKNKCNTLSVPRDLHVNAVERVCGEVLFSLQQTGKLLKVFDLEVAVKSVQTGDTNVTFATENTLTQEQRLDTLIAGLRGSGKDDIKCFRKIQW